VEAKFWGAALFGRTVVSLPSQLHNIIIQIFGGVLPQNVEFFQTLNSITETSRLIARDTKYCVVRIVSYNVTSRVAKYSSIPRTFRGIFLANLHNIFCTKEIFGCIRFVMRLKALAFAVEFISFSGYASTFVTGEVWVS